MSKTTIEKLAELIGVVDAVTMTAVNDPSLWHTWRERAELLRSVEGALLDYQNLINDLNEYIPDWEEQLERVA